MHVQALVPETPVERLDKRVLHGFSGQDEVELHATPVDPVLERTGHKLRPMIDGDRAGYRARPDGPIEGATLAVPPDMLGAASRIGLWRLH